MKLEQKNKTVKVMRRVSDWARFTTIGPFSLIVATYFTVGGDYLDGGVTAPAAQYNHILAGLWWALWTCLVVAGGAGLLAWFLDREQRKLEADWDKAIVLNGKFDREQSQAEFEERMRQLRLRLTGGEKLVATVDRELERRVSESDSKAG